MSQTLPCPFCGSRQGLDFHDGSTFRWLRFDCKGCGMGNEVRIATLGRVGEDAIEVAKLDAIREWNTRTEPRP